MQFPDGRRPAAVLTALLLVTSAVAVAGLVGATAPADGPDAAADRGHTANDPSRFGNDAAAARGLGSPRAEATVRRGPDGGRASVVGTGALADAPRTIEAVQRFALTPDRPGEVAVTRVYRIPDGVTGLETELPAGATVRGTSGFEATGDGGYEWDGETDDPSVTYAVAVNETDELAGPEGAGGRYLFVDAGEWALFRRPEMRVSWSWRGGDPVGLRQVQATDGPGHAGDWMVYLGRTTTHTRTAHGQTFTLVVPGRASLAESPGDVLDSLATAADQLRVGDRDENLSVFAAPTGSVEWGVRGLQYGDNDAWVRDVERLDGPDNTWLHEYVHTRQGFRTAESGQWVTEASATYYAALLALEQDRTDFRAFSEFLRRGTARPQSTATLADPATWQNAANYWKGSLVTGGVDRRIRLASDGTRSFGTVFSALNARTEPVDTAAVLAAVERAGGTEARQYAGRYATTGDVPEGWTAGEHADAFGGRPARFTYRFAEGGESPAVAVSGPYRNATVEGGSVALYTGETLTATGVVTNTGGASADYEQYFAVGGRVRETVSGSLAPGGTATHEFAHTFGSAGQRTVAFGADSITVEVYDTATASVADVRVNRTALDRPGAVAVAVRVVNRFDAPAERTVSVTRDGETVAERAVALGPAENRTVTVAVRLADPGEHVVGVDDQAVTVTVADPDAGGGGGPDGVSGTGTGFGALGALAAVLVATGLLARRRR